MTSFNALPCCLGAVANGILAMHRHNASGQWARGGSCNALLHYLEAVGGLLQYTISLRRDRGQYNSCNAVARCLGEVSTATRHCLGALCSGTPTMPRHTVLG